jgi:hypothetical protein
MATLFNLALSWLGRYSAAKSVGTPRQDGSYELLLTTPLGPQEIVRGEPVALQILFRPVLRFVLVLEAIMMVAGLLLRKWNGEALTVYFVIWAFFLYWTSAQGWWRYQKVLPVMWTSLNCGRPALAVWRTSGLHSWSWLWVLFNIHTLFSGFSNFPTGSPPELILVSFVAGIFLIFVLIRFLFGDTEAARRERRLISEFREIVREPVPHPHDPRFRKWDVKERFPWGWSLVRYQLHERLARER